MITSLFAAILALLYFRISTKIIGLRMKHKISLGFGENKRLETLMCAHSNFSSYVPLLLILTFMLETAGNVSEYFIYALGLAFTIGRFLHYLAFTTPNMNFNFRKFGMMLTLFPLVLLALLNIYSFLASQTSEFLSQKLSSF